MSPRKKTISFLEHTLLKNAVLDSFWKLDPRRLARNPVMFVVAVCAGLTTLLGFQALAGQGDAPAGFIWNITLWLWFTVLFANFAEAIAEGRGKAQAASLRKSRREVTAKKLRNPSDRPSPAPVPGSSLRKGDFFLVEAGDAIPADGEVVEGIASVNESAITGESAPVIRESGGDRCAVTGGTMILSDWLVVQVTSNPGETFLDRMIAMVEGAKRKKTPLEIALDILLAALTIVFLLATCTLLPFSIYSVKAAGQGSVISITILVSLLVCLIPTTIGALLSAIGIAGMDRMMSANVVAMSGRAVEAAGDVDVLLLDKTGTITHGNRQASEFIPAEGIVERELARAAFLSSLADDTPEGKSIVELARRLWRFPETDLTAAGGQAVPFTAQTRMSGINQNGQVYRKGAPDAIEKHVAAQGGRIPETVRQAVDRVARSGGTPLIVSEGPRALGVVHLKDIVKSGIRQRFQELRRMGIQTVMITGDNPVTAAAIAAEAGVDDYLAEATPEAKLELIRRQQEGGRMIAMTGDGTNDAPALAQADVAVAMNSGTPAAKEAANLVDLDSNPTKLIEIVEIGKQMLMTRGALTTFSLANDLAKYFAILPAAFTPVYPQLEVLNIMRLGSPSSAVLSAVIFNALIIVALIPLALRGIQYRPVGAVELLRKFLFIYGLGGIVAPFLGIKAIDLFLNAAGI